MSGPVLRLTKTALRTGVGPEGRDRLHAIKDLFLDGLYKLEDVEEGINSFTERRRPNWKHR